ncbi:MAG: TnpV protein [Clostridia bacterium]|nr:TnpV protein [Clostridia bacterium]
MSRQHKGIKFRYGNLHKEYIKTEFPMQYQILLMTGKLQPYLMTVQKSAAQLKRKLQEQMMNNPSSEFLTNLQSHRLTEQQIEEIILTEVVYQPLVITD